MYFVKIVSEKKTLKHDIIFDCFDNSVLHVNS